MRRPSDVRASSWTRRWAVGLVVLAVTGCSATPSPTPEPSDLPPLPSAAATPADGRPIQPVPDVRPAGLTDPPAGLGAARYTGQPLTWTGCGGRRECAQVRAPLDWADPDGTALTLALARIPASASPRLGTLFVNPGGPGGSGVDYLKGFSTTGLERWDVVGWDPRGVGGSTPVQCLPASQLDRYYSYDVSPDDDAEERRANAVETSFGAACLARSGALLEHVSTADTVRDLDLLRGLVGDARLNYLGFSYGTRIGALYAEQFPTRTGRLVLDGAVDLNSASSTTQLQGFELALNHFADWCVTQKCRLGDTRAAVLDQVGRLLGRLDAKPLRGLDGRSLSQQQGLQAVLYPLYGGVGGWKVLRTQLEAAALDGDGRGLLQIADAANERSADGSYGQLDAAFPAIRCLDSQDASVSDALATARRQNATAPVLGPYAGADRLCSLWPVASAPRPPQVDAAGAPTIVVVGTTGDPATPYPWAQQMVADLRSAVLVTYEGEGHTAYSSSTCVRDLAQAYLNDGRVPPVGARC